MPTCRIIVNETKCSESAWEAVNIAVRAKGWRVVEDDHCDYAIVLGGDGTIIESARYLSLKSIPIIGINFGKLGYLATFTLETFLEDLHNGLIEKYPISKRMLLAVRGVEQGKEWNLIAVNDLVIDIGPPFRTTTIELAINGNELASIRGDGVIISTPTGSTAYNMSAGGPIVQPELEGITITPKNPHRLSIRPIVVTGSQKIVIRVPDPEGVYAIIDGQAVIPIKTKAEISVFRSEHSMSLVQNTDYWSTLTKKLNWGM